MVKDHKNDVKEFEKPGPGADRRFAFQEGARVFTATQMSIASSVCR
jgi:hypothetical protein